MNAPPSNQADRLQYHKLQVTDEAGNNRCQDWTDGCIAVTDCATEEI
jgi:hypothetical protein